MTTKVEHTAVVSRFISGGGWGCYGTPCIPSLDHPGAHSGIDLIERMLGEVIPEGATIHITVEIVDRGTGQVKTNPWHNNPERSQYAQRDCPCPGDGSMVTP